MKWDDIELSEAHKRALDRKIGPNRSGPPLTEAEIRAGQGHRNGREPEATSWRGVDLAAVLAGDLTPLKPTTLARADGQPILYPGRVHDFHGEPETCKSWAAQVAVAEVLLAGESAVYLDFESEARDVIGHLVALGVPTERILAGLLYIRPEQPFNEAAAAELERQLPGLPAFAIAVLDGVNNSMATSGFEANSNTDVRKWWDGLVRTVQKATAGPTILIDHVAKDKNSRGRWAVGAGQKLAGIDGASFGFELITPFGIGRIGTVRISLDKDRPGSLRGLTGSGREIGKLRLSSLAEGTRVSSELMPPAAVQVDDDGRARWRPTFYMEKVSRALELASEPMSKAAIEREVSGKAEHVRAALTVLAEERYIDTLAGPRGALNHRSLKPFRADQDTANDMASQGENPPRPDLVPTSSRSTGDGVKSTSSTSSPSTRTGTRDGVEPSPRRGHLDPVSGDEVDLALGPLTAVDASKWVNAPGDRCPDCKWLGFKALEDGRRVCPKCRQTWRRS